jgi:hypothetical protein
MKIFFLLALIIPQVVNSQSFERELSIADSLFGEKKFTESFEIYKALLEQEQVASPGMLLRMAYIKEGLKEPDLTLYYLTLYHRTTGDQLAAEKIEALASKSRLIGYEQNLISNFQLLTHRYSLPIRVVMTLALGIILLLAVFSARRRGRPAIGWGVSLLLVAALFFVVENIPLLPQVGITAHTPTMLMSAPSSAAKVVEITGTGHRVQVMAKKDIWYKVKWRGETGYIRESDLAIIP